MTPETNYRAIVEEAGARYEGMQVGADGKAVGVHFTEKKTESTCFLFLHDFKLTRVKKELRDTRRAFRDAERGKGQ